MKISEIQEGKTYRCLFDDGPRRKVVRIFRLDGAKEPLVEYDNAAGRWTIKLRSFARWADCEAGTPEGVQYG